jgi:hypothetical protein
VASGKALESFYNPKTLIQTVILQSQKQPATPAEREFDEIVYNNQGQLIKRAEAIYKVEVVKSKIN